MAEGSVSSHSTHGLLEVGRIGKPHGLRGEVVVSLLTNMIDERTSVGARLRADDEWLTVETARPHQGRWIIRFTGIDDRNAADRLRGRTLMAEPLESEAEVFVHELIGKVVVDQEGRRHDEVISVIANPASDLLELADGRLVPLAFYRSHSDDEVVVDVPPGLLDDVHD